MVREEASQQGFEINKLRLEKVKIIPASQPARMVITNTVDAETKSKLLTALEQITFMQLDLKVINLSRNQPRFGVFL